MRCRRRPAGKLPASCRRTRAAQCTSSQSQSQGESESVSLSLPTSEGGKRLEEGGATNRILFTRS